MSPADGIVIVLLLAALAGIGRSSIRSRRQGRSRDGGYCSGCSYRKSCQNRQE